MKFLISAAALALIDASLAGAVGLPEQDPMVAKIREEFRSAQPMNMDELEKVFSLQQGDEKAPLNICRSYAALKDRFTVDEVSLQIHPHIDGYRSATTRFYSAAKPWISVTFRSTLFDDVEGRLVGQSRQEGTNPKGDYAYYRKGAGKVIIELSTPKDSLNSTHALAVDGSDLMQYIVCPLDEKGHVRIRK